MLKLDKKNKKGVSIMIGYVLLVTLGVIMAVLVYNWLKTYTPTENTQCPDVSIAIDEVLCEDGKLKISIKNTGRFSIEGYFIRGNFDSEEEIATQALSREDIDGFVSLPANEPLEPGDVRIKEIVFYEDACTEMGEKCTLPKCLSLPTGTCTDIPGGEVECNLAINDFDVSCIWNSDTNKCENIPGMPLATCESEITTETECDSANSYMGYQYCLPGWSNSYKIYDLEITPVKKIVNEKGKRILPTCTNAVIKERVDCTVYKLV